MSKKQISKKDQKNLSGLERLSKSLVWYTPLQIERGDHLTDTENRKGERPWSISPATGKYLYNFIIRNNIQNVLELGTSVGFSTLWICLALKNTKIKNSKIVSFERNPVKIRIAKKFLKKSETEKMVKIIRGEIIDELKSFIDKEAPKKTKRKLDLLFFDADRSNYDKYLDMLYPLITPSTYLIVDNAIDMKERLKTFVEKLKNDGWNVETVNVGDGLLVCKQT